MDIYEFNAVIQKHDGMDAAFIEFPYDVEQEFGTKGQVKVHASFDGHEYRGSLAKMGYRCHCLGLTQKIRKTIGKNPGDTVHVIIKRDEQPRVVEVPEDFEKLLGENEAANKFFNELSYSNKREYVQWIVSAKRVETRNKRLEDSINKLLNGVKHP
ncbi:MAG: YdeI/OmpD-associated family protein [Clostridia bacterium]|nr:YdeI/OmpD-associated family protein [Clostridia bacterium]